MAQETPNHYVLEDGSERWEVDDKLHREDGPALITPEGQFWYRHGQPMPPDEVARIQQWRADKDRAAAQEIALRQGENAAAEMRAGTVRNVKPLKPIRFGI